MMVLGIQKSVIDQVLHANVLQRINDSAYYGNEYSLNEVMNNLTAAIFVADKNATTLSQSLQANRVRFSLEQNEQIRQFGKSRCTIPAAEYFG